MNLEIISFLESFEKKSYIWNELIVFIQNVTKKTS